jgi:hypothetical protein
LDVVGSGADVSVGEGRCRWPVVRGCGSQHPSQVTSEGQLWFIVGTALFWHWNNAHDLDAYRTRCAGLVIEHPCHGYDLDRTIAERGIRQWADVAFSSIYYVLGKLETRGLVRSEHGDGPKSRRVYSATDEGRTAATNAAAGMLSNAAPAF